MSKKKTLFFGKLIRALVDFIARVVGDGGVTESTGCIGELDADVVMYPSGYKATKLYSQKAVPVYGAELIVNGDFEDGSTGWTAEASWTIENGIAVCDNSVASNLYTGIVFTIGKYYQSSFDVVSSNGGNILVYHGSSVTEEITAIVGRHTINGISDGQVLVIRNNGFAGVIDNVSVKEITTGDCDFDVARNSIATRVNASGLIEEVAIDVPRLDYSDGACPVLLTEPQSTNLITYSEDFSEWLFSSSAVVDSNTVVSPDGTLNASKFSSESALTNINIKEIVALGSGNYTQSLYVKQGDFDSLRLRISGTDVGTSGQTLSIYDFSFITEQITKVSGGTVDNTKVDVFGNEWYRISLSFSATTITQQVIYCQPNGGSDIGGVYIWGAQLEELTYPTSYIPTAGSTVTRLADAVTGAGDVNSFNSEEGVFYMEMAALADDGTSRFISISDGTYDNTVTIIFHATSNQIWGYIKVSGLATAILIHTLNDVTSYTKVALKWKLNDFSLWVDGIEEATDSLGTMPIANTLNELRFYRGDLSSPFFGKTKALKVFKRALEDDELLYLTTNGDLPEWNTYDKMATAFNYTIQ